MDGHKLPAGKRIVTVQLGPELLSVLDDLRWWLRPKRGATKLPSRSEVLRKAVRRLYLEVRRRHAG